MNIEEKTKLHYWYVNKTERNGKSYILAHGNVSGHKKLEDTTFIHTSKIQSSIVDRDNGELIITTTNTEYHCPLEYCQWNQQDKNADLIPEYEYIKTHYKNKLKMPEIDEDKVLLTFSNFDKYYFHSIYCKLSSEGKTVHFCMYPHIGMFEDSVLISNEDSVPIDIRYFPYSQSAEFYCESTGEMPLFVENIGDTMFGVSTHCGLIKLAPGERKEVKVENTDREEA